MKKEVVFCKDCTWSNAEYLKEIGIEQKRKCYCVLLDRWMWNRGFCSLGAKEVRK